MKPNRESLIQEFHEAFGLAIDEVPNITLLKLRKTLIEEEVRELFVEMDTAIELLNSGKPVPESLWADMLKELADVQVVLSGASVALAPLKRLEEAFVRVHESNMSKLGRNGKPIYREDGKVLKGSNYTPPAMDDLVNEKTRG